MLNKCLAELVKSVLLNACGGGIAWPKTHKTRTKHKIPIQCWLTTLECSRCSLNGYSIDSILPTNALWQVIQEKYTENTTKFRYAKFQNKICKKRN